LAQLFRNLDHNHHITTANNFFFNYTTSIFRHTINSIPFNSLYPSIVRILNILYIQQFKTISKQVRTSHYTCCNAESAFKNVYGKRTDMYACYTENGKMTGNKFIDCVKVKVVAMENYKNTTL